MNLLVPVWGISSESGIWAQVTQKLFLYNFMSLLVSDKIQLIFGNKWAPITRVCLYRFMRYLLRDKIQSIFGSERTFVTGKSFVMNLPVSVWGISYGSGIWAQVTLKLFLGNFMSLLVGDKIQLIFGSKWAPVTRICLNSFMCLLVKDKIQSIFGSEWAFVTRKCHGRFMNFFVPL